MGIQNAFKRLSKRVVPRHYELTLQPDLQTFVFTGKVKICVDVTKETSYIVLNCLELSITNAVFTTGEGTEVQPTDIKYNEEKETVKIKFGNALSVGPGILSLDFSGLLNDKLKGFYRSAQGSGESIQYAAVTHFEPTNARRAFPCWDEPAIKCTFDITLVVAEDKIALSNMNVIDTTEHPDRKDLKVVSFATTPKMSTYIIAFIVGDFDFVEDNTDRGVLVRVYTSKGKAELGRFALDVAKRTLMYYEEYFGFPYALPKIDLIGIADFGIGAMENWGLVTYRERYLLVDDEGTAAETKQHVAEIIGHELAHNWFGNLVTMEWWTHLWLKEGFANFIEYLCVDYLFPEYEIWTQFLISQNITAQKLDALSNSHPIEVLVSHPSECDEIFDRISYSKGASIIRMLHTYVGEKAFKTALHLYLDKHKFGNTITEDLWHELEIASKKPVGDVMSTWTKQMGFPVISVTREMIGENKVALKLTQTKFNVGDQDSKGYKWMVPINIATSHDPEKLFFNTLMPDSDMVLYLDNLSAHDWIKLNVGQTDYYRVKYSEELLELLIPAIKDKTLSNRDRLGIQNDVFNLAYAGYMPILDYFKILEAYSGENDYTVWSDIILNVSILMSLFERTECFDQMKSFVVTLCKCIAETIGYEKVENEGNLIGMLRGNVYSMLGILNAEYVVTKFRKLFSDHVNGVAKIDTDLRSAVYATVATHGNEDTLKQMKELYLKSDIVDERQRILSHLGRCQSDELRNEALEFALSADVRNQDTLLALAGCMNSNEGRIQSWGFIKERWDILQARCIGGHARSNLIMKSVDSFATTDEFDDVKDFLSSHPVPSAERAIKQSLEKIQHNIKLLERISTLTFAFASFKLD